MGHLDGFHSLPRRDLVGLGRGPEGPMLQPWLQHRGLAPRREQWELWGLDLALRPRQAGQLAWKELRERTSPFPDFHVHSSAPRGGSRPPSPPVKRRWRSYPHSSWGCGEGTTFKMLAFEYG